MRILGLLVLCAAANALQAGFRPLSATVATVTARTPVVLAQENSPFAKLANVPAPALAATFSGAGLVVAAALVSSTAGPPDAAPFAVAAIGLLKLGEVLLGE